MAGKARHHMGAHLGVLVHTREAANDRPVGHMHMACQGRVVGQNGLVADLAIMGDMHIGHDPVVITDPRHPAILGGAGVEGAELADGVAVADLQAGRLAGIFFVLRHAAERGMCMDLVGLTDRGDALDHAVRTYFGVGADANLGANNCVRPN